MTKPIALAMVSEDRDMRVPPLSLLYIGGHLKRHGYGTDDHSERLQAQHHSPLYRPALLFSLGRLKPLYAVPVSSQIDQILGRWRYFR